VAAEVLSEDIESSWELHRKQAWNRSWSSALHPGRCR